MPLFTWLRATYMDTSITDSTFMEKKIADKTQTWQYAPEIITGWRPPRGLHRWKHYPTEIEQKNNK